MGSLRNFITSLHKSTERDYVGRMMDEKVSCMIKAKEYEYDYWDGDRRCGYGGYKYDGRWKSVAQSLIDIYQLGPRARILDVGCGMAHLLYELQQLLPDAELSGFDVSRYAIQHSPETIRDKLINYRAEDIYPFGDDYFDLVMSISTLHNLRIFELDTALREIERVGKQAYILVESFRNERELFNLQCWGLTPYAFFDPASWIWLLRHFGYSGDYEFIYFE